MWHWAEGAHPCTHLPQSVISCRQCSAAQHLGTLSWGCPRYALQAAPGSVAMKTCVTWRLFKYNLRLLPLCQEHKPPLSSTGHRCSASSLRSMIKLFRDECTWICPLSLCQPEATLLELRCSACTAAAEMLQSLVQRCHCPTSQDGIILCTTTAGFQSPQPARCTAQQAGEWARSRQPGHTDCGPELHRAAQLKAAPLPVAASWGGSKWQQRQPWGLQDRDTRSRMDKAVGSIPAVGAGTTSPPPSPSPLQC